MLPAGAHTPRGPPKVRYKTWGRAARAPKSILKVFVLIHSCGMSLGQTDEINADSAIHGQHAAEARHDTIQMGALGPPAHPHTPKAQRNEGEACRDGHAGTCSAASRYAMATAHAASYMQELTHACMHRKCTQDDCDEDDDSDASTESDDDGQTSWRGLDAAEEQELEQAVDQGTTDAAEARPSPALDDVDWDRDQQGQSLSRVTEEQSTLAPSIAISRQIISSGRRTASQPARARSKQSAKQVR
jgi:hypothetical protein